MFQYRIPNLLDHLQAYIKPNNPNHNVLAVEYVEWIDSSSFLSDAQKKDWKDTELALYACRVFPDTNQGALRVCLQYLMLSLMVEYLTDAPSTVTQAQKWADIYKQVFKQTLRGETEEIATIMKQFADYVLNAIKDPYKPYLVEDNILLAEGMIKEAADRKNPDPELTLEMYMKVRRDTVGIRSALDIGRWIYEIDILPEILTHPDIAKLEKQVVDLVFLTNDLYSYKKEFTACGAHHNYVTIALSDPIAGLREYDRQGAIDYTYRKFCEVLADFEHQKKTLPSFGESEDVKVAMYIEIMMDIIVGNLQWSLECARYGHFASAPNWGDVVFDMDTL